MYTCTCTSRLGLNIVPQLIKTKEILMFSSNTYLFPIYFQGTKGLALFYLDVKNEDGSLNNMELVQLKNKLGTRQLPTAELLLDGSVAYKVRFHWLVCVTCTVGDLKSICAEP